MGNVAIGSFEIRVKSATPPGPKPFSCSITEFPNYKIHKKIILESEKLSPGSLDTCSRHHLI
jgi:hypothetical protein